MELEKIVKVTGRAVNVAGDDIDTDRIIPARFMKCVTFDGLGEYLFYDVRKDEDGSLKDHPLNTPEHEGATILVSGQNFGCGSSREHAPQAIYRAGFRAVIAEGFAEIFFGNSTNLGIPCAVLAHDDRVALSEAIEANPALEVTIDVDTQQVHYGDKTVPCVIRPAAQMALTSGKWDPLGDLMDGADAVKATASTLPYLKG